MKKIYLLLFCASFLVGNAQIDWKRSVATSNVPSWMGSNTERGMGALNDKMYVVSRSSGTKIKIINGIDGTDLGEVSDYTGVSGGTFALNDVEVSTNGAILACNLMSSAYAGSATPDSTFTIYKWDNETATPSVYATYVASSAADHVRLGDNFSVTGDVSGNAVIFAAGRVGTTTVYKVIRWIVTAGVLGTPTVITIPPLATGTGVLSVTPLSISANPDFILNASGSAPVKYNADGTITSETVSNIAITSNDIRYFEAGTKKYIASYIYGTNGEYVKLVDVTAGLSKATTIAVTPTLGTVSNVNTSGGLGLKIIPDLVDGINNTITVYALGANNGISGTTLLLNGAVLSNKEFSVSEAKIFPNPAGNEFQITLNNAVEKNAEVTIYDLNGRQIKYSKLTSKTQYISISNLNKGLYMVRIKNGNSQSTTKLLKK